jgi:DNA-binding SARP family transcriptional activator
MEPIRVTLFGKLCIQLGGADLPGLEARKVQELFCYLLLNRNASHHRERLATLFWENQTTTNSRKYLRQALWQLQSALDEPGGQREPVLLVDDEWIQVNPAAALWIDVAVLEDAFRAVQSLSAAQLSEAQALRLEEAVRLYRGDLLDGWYGDWCIFERERLQSMYLGALDKLAGSCDARQDYGRGVTYCAAILRCDRARERTYRQLMRMHYLAGDRTAALRAYESCMAALQEELGVEPARSTLALYADICADRLTIEQPPMEAVTTQIVAPPAVAQPGLYDLFQTLVYLQAGVKILSVQVEECLHAIERTIRQ